VGSRNPFVIGGRRGDCAHCPKGRLGLSDLIERAQNALDHPFAAVVRVCATPERQINREQYVYYVVPGTRRVPTART
jgi:hypothetical protein